MADRSIGSIRTKEAFQEVLDYIADNASKLGELVTEQSLPIDTLTIFTQDLDEFKFLEPIVREYGEESDKAHGLTLYIDSNFEVQGNHIRYLGLRRPDKTRPQLGYADLVSDDLRALQQSLKDSPYAEPVKSGLDQRMLELGHPEFDVLGYVVDAADH